MNIAAHQMGDSGMLQARHHRPGRGSKPVGKARASFRQSPFRAATARYCGGHDDRSHNQEPSKQTEQQRQPGGARLRAGNVERCARILCINALSVSDAVMSDNIGTRRRPTPSKPAARTASAAAQSPLKPAKVVKSWTNAIACRTKADIGEPESVTLGLCIGRSLLYRAGWC
jgi:hypothetical protein